MGDGARPRYEDVEGAPFRIGSCVRVTQVDLLYEDDDEGTYVGRVGTLLYYEYDCGSGQTFPHDPMIGVDFGDGVSGLEFWSEELAAVPSKPSPRSAV